MCNCNARISIFLLLVLTAFPVAAQIRFTDIEVRYVRADRLEFEQDDAILTIDQKVGRLAVSSKIRTLDVTFDDIAHAIIEVNTHGKRAGFGASFVGFLAGGLLFGDLIATSIDKPFDNDHFVLFEVKGPTASSSFLINVDNKAVPSVLKALKAALGEKLVVSTFSERVERLGDDFDPPKVKIHAVPTEKQHPIAEVRRDKALIFISAPSSIMIRMKSEKRGFAVPIYANGRLVGAVGPGDYTSFYADPGDYLLVGDTPSPVGLRMRAEAGREYYLTLTIYAKGFRLRSFLSRHSKEFVIFEITGSRWMDWKIVKKDE